MSPSVKSESVPLVQPEARLDHATETASDIQLRYEEYANEMQTLETLARKGEAGQLVLDRIKELERIFLTITNSTVKELSMYMTDSNALRKTAELASTNAEHIRYGDLGPTLPLGKFLQAAKRYMNPDLGDAQVGLSQLEINERFNSLDWKKLGNWFYLKTNVAVPSHFLYGPLATKVRTMAPRTRTVDDTVSTNAKTAQRITASELREDPEQTTAGMVKAAFKVLVNKDPDTKVNMFRFFINPHSFGQSVENLFYTSFLARDGKIIIGAGPDNAPYVQISKISSEEIPEEQRTQLSHHIASFDYSVWKTCIEKYNITESYIPHRENEEDTMSDSETEQEIEQDADGGDDFNTEEGI